MTTLKPYVTIDCETTGIDPATDRILTFAVHKRWPNRQHNGNEWKFNPGRLIPKSATEIHGITNEDVAQEHPFTKARAMQIIEFIGVDAILVGFNILKFDIPIFMAELERCGCSVEFPPPGMAVIDCLNIFRKKFPHDLDAAALRYAAQKRASNQHDALEDCELTANILEGQLQQHPDLAELTVDDLARWSQPDGMVDFSGKLFRDRDGDVCYGIGKDYAKKIKDAPSFAHWMLTKNFPPDTKRAVEAELRRIGGGK